MVTLVGTQTNFNDALKELLELEYDANEAYTAAIDRLKSDNLKRKLTEFRSDHERHIKDISQLLKDINSEVPHGPSGKQILLIGKIAISKLIGDKAILDAMLSAEEDTNTAYERMVIHDSKEDPNNILQHGLNDEHTHRNWIKQAIAQLS